MSLPSDSWTNASAVDTEALSSSEPDAVECIRSTRPSDHEEQDWSNDYGEGRRGRLEDVAPGGRRDPSDRTGRSRAFDLQHSRGLSPPDALVYSSVLSHLRSSAPLRRAASCFVTRDRDFTDANIESDLERLGCKILFKCEDGLGYARSRLP